MESDKAIGLIIDEFCSATAKNDKFHSAHEGYGVLLEELDELWDEVKKKDCNRDIELMRKEAVQVGAMALRFIVDLT